MKKLIFLLLFVSLNTLAVPVDITFTAPETRENGEALLNSEISAYRLYKIENGQEVKQGQDLPHISGSSELAYTVDIDFPNQTDVIELCIRSVDTEGKESEVCSESVAFGYSISSPTAPTNLQVGSSVVTIHIITIN